MIGRLEKRADMSTGNRGAKRCDRLIEARLRQPDDIEIALRHDRATTFAYRVSCFVQSVQLLPLSEDRRLGRVQILWLTDIENPRSEPNHLPARIANWKHHAASKTVVTLAFVGNHEDRFHQLRIVIIVEGSAQRLPGVGRIAQRETSGGVTGNTSPLQVLDRKSAVFQLSTIEVGRPRQYVGQPPSLRMRIGCALGFRNLHAGHLSQITYGVDITLSAMLHQKPDGAAMRAAPEAMKELLG